MGFFEELRRRLDAFNEIGKCVEDDVVDNERIALEELLQLPDFVGPLESIPKNRSQVYSIYGRAPKDRNPAHTKFPKAKLTSVRNLPGKWNSNSGKLYTLAYMEEYLREALSRCERLGVIDEVWKLGSYNHRHVRHNTNNPLSYHSWGAAIDVNPPDNFATSITKETIWPPFSKQCLERYPNHLSLQAVMAFKSVGFSWGGDWGRDDWYSCVKLYGIGWDAEDLSMVEVIGQGRVRKFKWPEEWNTMTFYDPMHFELLQR